MTRDVQQLRQSDGETANAGDVDVDAEHDPEVSRRASTAGLRREIQKKASGVTGEQHVHDAAARGVETPSQALPFADRIQASFGDHDVSGIQAHVDPGSARAIGAEAYATGDHVVFGKQPDLHTAAHEAAHVVQQQQGVQLKGGVGAEGDAYERQADAVADQVVAGKPAGHLLGAAAAGAGSAGPAVQRKPAAKATDPKATHDTSDTFSMGSCQSALVYLAKRFHSWAPTLREARHFDVNTEAGAGPAQNTIVAIFDTAKNDVERVSELILTASKDERRFLAPDVKRVQGAFTRFYNEMSISAGWLAGYYPPRLEVHEIEVVVDGLTSAIGIDERLAPDLSVPEGDEKALSRSMINDQFDALEAAIASVKSGNDNDAGRVDLHLRYLDGIATEHAAELKSHKPKLKALLKDVEKIRTDHPALADRLSEAHNHLTRLVH